MVLDDILLDTGSAATVFCTNSLIALGIAPQPTDEVRLMVGVGDSTEAVIEREIDGLAIGNLRASPFTIQMGLLDYQIDMNGIIGVDFLLATRAVLDFAHQRIFIEAS